MMMMMMMMTAVCKRTANMAAALSPKINKKTQTKRELLHAAHTGIRLQNAIAVYN